MESIRVRQILAETGAILEGHFVGTNGNHLSVYVAKDRATRLTSVASELCAGIAEQFANTDIDAVVAPAVGGIALSQWTAHHLTRLRPDRPEVLALYTEHEDVVLRERRRGGDPFAVTVSLSEVTEVKEGEQVILRRPKFVLKRGFDADVLGKCVLEVEDVLTTGGSAAHTANAIIKAGGSLSGLGVLVNGGNVTTTDIHQSLPRLEALMVVDRQIFTEADCAKHGLCAQGVPVNTEFGHGEAFLAQQ